MSGTPSVETLDEPGLVAIDTRTAGLSKVTAGYLLAAPRPALVECGPALSIDNVIAALRDLGLEPGDLAYLVLTHIHIDHAGGAGDIAAAFPAATVVASEVGARHLVDPERLNASTRRVYGDLYDTVYGDCTPIPAERVRGVADGDVLDLGGGRKLEILYTPGHAKHHITPFEPDAGLLFVGDSVGVKLPGVSTVRPATPPPDFDLVLAHRTLARYRALDPARVYLAHYGALDPPQEALAEADEQLRLWAGLAEDARAEARAAGLPDEVEHIAETLAARFSEQLVPLEGDAEGEARMRLISGYASNAMGLARYFDLRDEGRVTAE